jgi:hypothetical protein
MDMVVLDAIGEDYSMISVPVRKAPPKIGMIDDLCAGKKGTSKGRNDRE